MEITNKSGIYKILCWSTNKFYIGSAVRVRHRINCHKSELRTREHKNSKLQNAWNKYGELDFSFHVLEYCDKDKLIECEQIYLDLLKPELNILLIANSSFGYKHTEEAKAKMRISSMNKIILDATRQKMANSLKGKPKSKEHALKIKLSKTGMPCSENRKLKIKKAYHERTAKQLLINISNPMRIENGD